jgi:hypothetical protein
MPHSPNTPAPTRRETLTVALIAALVVALAAYRASVGQTFYDDTFYAVVPWRFAHGARFLIDELSFQTVAEMISVPLVWLWERVFGLAGMVLAIRLLWVALATAGAWLACRLLRGTTSLAVAAIAVAVPLLAPAYHVFAPTYNTLSSLLLTLAVLLGFSAMRDRSAALAGWAGVAIALGSAAYPPLAPAALVLLVTFAAMARDRRLIARAVLVAAGVGAAVGVALLARVSLADVRSALAFGSANVSNFATPLGKFSWVFGNTGSALVSVWLLPMWALALAASAPQVPARVRSVALALIPAAAAVPGISLLLRGETITFGISAQSWLIIMCAGAVVPSLLAAARLGRTDLLRLAGLAAPFSTVGYLTVAYVTNSSWNRGMPAIALAPLAVAILLCWATALALDGGTAVLAAGAGITLVVVFALLFSSVFGDNSLWQPLTRVRHGAYAGLLTSPEHDAKLAALNDRARRWIKPGDTVAFLGQADAYLSTRGTPLTPAAWLYLGPADAAALDYYKRVGATPDAVLVSDRDVNNAGGYSALGATDPMLHWVMTTYRRVDRAGGFSFFVRR